MRLRLLISRLSSAQTRGAAARGLAVLCGAGFGATVVVLAARGMPERWFFALLVWALFVYAPLRMALEAAATLAPTLRRRLAAESDGDAPLRSAAGAELAVDRLLEQTVVMPRIATPVQRAKARDGALALALALREQADGWPAAVGMVLGCVDRWVSEIGPWARHAAGQNIQARWREVRALAAMAGMTRILVELAAREGRLPEGSQAGPGLQSRREFLEACLDYCDDLALELEVPSWTVAALGLPISTRETAVREAWRLYVETGPPALDARRAFVTLVLRPAESSPPGPPSAS